MRDASTEEQEDWNLEEFRCIISDLFVAKLRASFNSSEENYGSQLISRGSLFRELLNNKNRDQAPVKKVGRKLSPWHSSDFSLDFSPISDLSFECSNIKMLEETDESTTYRTLKERSISGETGGKSCRNCLDNRHDLEIEEDLIGRFSEFWPTNCAMNPIAKKRGLGMFMVVEVTIDDLGRSRIKISSDGMRLSDQMTREIRGSAIPTGSIVPLYGDDIPSWQGIKLIFNQMVEASTNDVSRIWISKGYREKLVFRGIKNIRKRALRKGPDEFVVSSNSVVKSLLDIIKVIQESWDPSAFDDPRFFLQRGIDVEGLGSGTGWPVQFIQMSEKTCDFIKSGIEERFHTPILVRGINDMKRGEILVRLDNIEFWR